MKISPISSFSLQHQVNNKNVSFKSTYDDIVEDVAKKFQYVKDPYNAICDELDKYDCSRNFLMISEVEDRIKQLKQQHLLIDAELRNVQTAIDAKDGQIRTEVVTQGRLNHQIVEAQQRNAFEKIKLSNIIASYNRVVEVKCQLADKYVNLFEIDGDKKFPNAIMVSGLKNEDEREQILNYLETKNCKILKTDFDKIPLGQVIKEIYGLKSKIKKSGEHSILYINNFYKYTVPTEENMAIISKLKGTLSGCSEDFNTTVLVFENDPKRLDEAIIGGHRFEKKIDVSGIKGDVSSVFVPKYDGFTFVYNEDENSQVDLYLGDCGKNPSLLWADTTSYKKVQDIISRLDEIKAQDKFKNTKYLQIPYPEEAKYLNGFHVLSHRKTYDGKTILEKKI